MLMLYLEHKRNLTIKLSNRPTREMLTMRGIISESDTTYVRCK